MQTTNGIRLAQQPIPELQALRGRHQRRQNEAITPGTNLLADVTGEALEIIAEFKENALIECFGIHVRMGEGEYTTIGFTPRQGKLFVDCRHSGQSDFYAGFASIQVVDFNSTNGVIRLHIFVDRSSMFLETMVRWSSLISFSLPSKARA